MLLLDSGNVMWKTRSNTFGKETNQAPKLYIARHCFADNIDRLILSSMNNAFQFNYTIKKFGSFELLEHCTHCTARCLLAGAQVLNPIGSKRIQIKSKTISIGFLCLTKTFSAILSYGLTEL